MLKILVALTAVVVTSCNLVSPETQEVDSGKTKLDQGEIEQLCEDLKRPLNPPSEATSSESKLERHFRLAFSYETAGDFDQAIFHYRKAAELSKCDCDRLHAEAGEKAAKEARELFEKEGIAARPTQYFWGRLQQLTQTLPCVEIKY